jgi:lipoprotein-anchoring transpeptidase ErfK/SrfK
MRKQSGRVALAAMLMIGTGGLTQARERVAFEANVAPGTIVVRTAERKLYLALGDGSAIRYSVAVGKAGKQWFGTGRDRRQARRARLVAAGRGQARQPALPLVIPGGSPRNPMGAAALTLNRGEYAIHGTNNPASIGTYASYGCIRMHNRDIVDLFERVSVGTPVVVTR